MFGKSIFSSTMRKSLSILTGSIQNLTSSIKQFGYKPSQKTCSGFSEFVLVDPEFYQESDFEEENVNEEDSSECVDFEHVDKSSLDLKEENEEESVVSKSLKNNENSSCLLNQSEEDIFLNKELRKEESQIFKECSSSYPECDFVVINRDAEDNWVHDSDPNKDLVFICTNEIEELKYQLCEFDFESGICESVKEKKCQIDFVNNLKNDFVYVDQNDIEEEEDFYDDYHNEEKEYGINFVNDRNLINDFVYIDQKDIEDDYQNQEKESQIDFMNNQKLMDSSEMTIFDYKLPTDDFVYIHGACHEEDEEVIEYLTVLTCFLTYRNLKTLFEVVKEYAWTIFYKQ